MPFFGFGIRTMFALQNGVTSFLNVK